MELTLFYSIRNLFFILEMQKVLSGVVRAFFKLREIDKPEEKGVKQDTTGCELVFSHLL